MENMRRLLPSAASLIIFEAAGRHQNFTRAAAELGMSQAAVSYAVRSLEDQLGVSLFHRVHRAVELTEAGERFHADVSVGLARIQKSAEDIRAKGRETNVTLAASTAFASMWMLPRLNRLREDLPEIDLRIQTGVRDLNLDEEPIPLGIRGGDPAQWPRYHAALLADEVITAVATPAYVEAHGMPKKPADLLRHSLIHLEEPVRRACDWTEWFASAGLAYPAQGKRLAINDYVLVIQAVLAGEGIALGWDHLIAGQVRSGALVPVAGHVLRTGQAFYVVWPRSRELNSQAGRIRDWLLKEGARDRADDVAGRDDGQRATASR
ncbi:MULTISPECIES: LysR substrate-binding domain-containing protein [Sinorhizobium]|uniref:LysR family transcriptional regulator n=1 Tax=Sinorhizobium americanum TaxID=194963 RepID=A0A2S3YHV7_9HYPH|nr:MULTISPECIES: LysR substrate-binding domain-containing protein [Sinorhizobium]ASY55477.1 Glycine cleavage system transcriptional activator [Sinorhizobium sp. CCBAU 05631]PDT40732.1 LysR family transcriptional regulator [Sinorhizobium sp. FG01]PDT52175.1 LysR family transcriptional regulator [Sinorhizobium sp. NG07B]POH26329.1 LysR family transcriptional regulator [Sinorhizobium americanum]POH27908.1 LysR family transcriptional regulator [Sinorhizobium americanum]